MNAAPEPAAADGRDAHAGPAGGPAAPEPPDDLIRRTTGFLAGHIRPLPDERRFALAAAPPAPGAPAAAPDEPRHEGTHR